MCIPFDLELIKTTGIEAYKKKIKSKINEAAFKYLKDLQQTHSKVKNVKYEKFETQQYLTSQLFTNKETSLLYSLRTKTTKIFKANFTSLYNGNVECPLKCWDINRHEPAPPDTQEHLFVCKKVNVISNNVDVSKSEYNDLFKDV